MLIKNYNNIINNRTDIYLKKRRKDILDVISTAVEAVNPYNILKNIIKENKIILNKGIIDINNYDNIFLIGFGKASLKMGDAINESFDVKKGILITNKKENYFENPNIKIIEAGHPIPNQNSINGAKKILNLIKNCQKNDLLVILISGGGSSLLCYPRIPLKDLKDTTKMLLRTKMTISEINTIRKHISYVKGGQLIKDAKCKVVSLIISDIINDPIEFIASGPSYPDSTTYQDAKNILINYEIWDFIPKSVCKVIDNGIRGLIPETPKNKNQIFNEINNFIIANNELACIKAEKKAKEIGYMTKIITTSFDGEARYVGKNLINYINKNKLEYNKPKMYISGGETTVEVLGSGKGGRNQEIVLGLIEYIHNKNFVIASFATDGIDGNSIAAGAIADRESFELALEKNCNPSFYLKNNNSFKFFQDIGDLIITGPTGTNVMDIQIIIEE
jgi:hydroxypyruvate reductase/glycerate 2-kinase